MFHVVYVSRESRPFLEADAQAVLEPARRFNTDRGVTGLLVHSAGRFLQVLEGELEDVEAAFRRAAASTRHSELLRTPAVPVAGRVFPQWSMGFATAAPGALVSEVLEPLVGHQLLAGHEVRAVLLDRYVELASA